MNERDPLDEALSGPLSGPIVGWASQRCTSDSTFVLPDHKIEACRKTETRPGRAVPGVLSYPILSDLLNCQEARRSCE